MSFEILSEVETLEAAIAGASLARYGDGELKLALGKDCVSQIAKPALTAELRQILAAGGPALVCLPNAERTSKPESWERYTHPKKAEPKYSRLFGPHRYGSAFISRPDSAPWIDTPQYWERLVDLWRDRDVVLVAGTDRSLRPADFSEARSLREVRGPRRDAYAEIDRIEAEIGQPSGPVILCLGACATVLADRLAKKGVHAVDLGHVGMFRRHAGAYRHAPEDLASAAYRAQLRQLHTGGKWGADGARHAEAVLAWAEQLRAESILDYGSGSGELAAAIAPRRVMQYDPGIVGREALPKPVDLVVATDVLEHVEPDRLAAVLDHIKRLAGRGAYLVIATRPARALLPDGRNAHLIVEPAEWWLRQLSGLGWILDQVDVEAGRQMTVRIRA